MKASLLSFNNGLKDLRDYIRAIQLESQLLSSELNELAPMAHEYILIELKEHSLYNNTNKKRFDYNTSIVSLYGFFEQYIESLVRFYLRQLNKIIPRYNGMPEVILKNQIELSLRLMSPSEQARYHGTVTTYRLISNLHSCLNEDDNYCINVEAFSHHNANFRANNIQETFAHIGIENITDRALKCPSFLRYWANKYPEAHVNPENPQIRLNAISFINELADRRNEVAHGVPTEDLLSNELILERIDFFEAYGNAIYEIAYSDLLTHKLNHSSNKMLTPTKIFGKNVFSLFTDGLEIMQGDLIIAEPSNKNFPLQISEIKEIQINGKSIKKIPGTCKDEIAIRVSFTVKKNHKLYLMSHPSD